jgi:hypothetical protein
MPRYFFDISDGGPKRDDVGTECADLDVVRKQAMRTLPDIAGDELQKNGDRHTFTVLVTDEDGQPIYAGTLTYTGLWLLR